jgi:hypothetical protein
MVAEQSIYRDIAGLKWPGHKLEGSGPIAVVLGCDYRVVLCDMPMTARLVAAERCGQYCNHEPHNVWHRIHVLNQQPVAAPYRKRPRWASQMERD